MVSILEEREIEPHRCEHSCQALPQAGWLGDLCSSCVLLGGLRTVPPGGLCGLCWPKGLPWYLLTLGAQPAAGECACSCVCSCVHTTLTSDRVGEVALENTWPRSRKWHRDSGGSWVEKLGGPRNRHVVFFHGRRSKKRVMGCRTKAEIWRPG